MDVPETTVLILVILIFINAFLILMRTSLTQSHKKRIEELLEDDEEQMNRLCAMLDDPEDVLAGLIICSNICHFAIGISVGIGIITYLYDFMKSILPVLPYLYLLCFILSVLFFLFMSILFGTLLPKRMAQTRPEHYLLKYTRFLFTFYSITRPIINMLSSSVNMLIMISGKNLPSDENVTEDEVKDLIEKATEEGTLEKVEQDMVDNIFHMSDQTAYSLMTPRTQIKWLDIEDGPVMNLQIIKNAPNEIFLVGKNNLDNLLGFIYAKDILRSALDGKLTEIKNFIKKPIFIPRSMETFRVIDKLRQNNADEAVVTDEYGGVIGIITLKDILEEILGDVSSPQDDESVQVIQHSENSWYVDGLCDIDDFKEKFSVDDLPDEDRAHYQTVGGFLVSYFGYIPKTGEIKTWHDLRFEITQMDRNRIDKILITDLGMQKPRHK